MPLPIPNPEDLTSEEALAEAWNQVQALNTESYDRFMAVVKEYGWGSPEAEEAILVRGSESSQIATFNDYWRGIREILGFVPSLVQVRSLDG